MNLADLPRTLVYVHPGDIHAFWPYVAPRLVKVKQKTEARWIPEDVYAALKANAASLHIAEEGPNYVGFVVLQQRQDYDGKTLWVWVAYSDGPDVVEKCEPELVAFAKNIGAKRLEFSSPRKWERRLKVLGWSESHAVFVKEVP
jgi:hypothetical protein